MAGTDRNKSISIKLTLEEQNSLIQASAIEHQPSLATWIRQAALQRADVVVATQSRDDEIALLREELAELREKISNVQRDADSAISLANSALR